jgi:hypothetical protein
VAHKIKNMSRYWAPCPVDRFVIFLHLNEVEFMKSVYEKARDFFNTTNLRYSDVDVLKLEQLLKEQDRDTRHACSMAVLDCSIICETPNGNDAISSDDAHVACINAKAI